MVRKLYILVLSLTVFALWGCNKDSGCFAPPFEGEVCTQQEVDLGLSAKWAGYNIGAASPQEYGNWYAWGETISKQVYLESSYSKPGSSIILEENDVASKEWGYGWHLPSVANIQELIDNCDIRFSSYCGIDGWTVTSRVHGYEGTTIFFPASGYKAGENHNYAGSQCVFWSNSLTEEGSSHAINAFFEGNTLKLNAPPKGVGGTLWCGYAVRAVRQFFLDIDTGDISCNRDETEFIFHVSGNAKWRAGVTGKGASVSPQSGEGASVITVTLPINTTEDNHYFDVNVESDDAGIVKSFRITQFGIVPEFKISGSTETQTDWDDTAPIQINLSASAGVSWTAVVMSGVVPVTDAVISPSSGTGSASIEVTLPEWYDTQNEGIHEVVITTDNERIPEEIRSLVYSVNRTRCTYVPFGFVWGKDFLDALKSAYDADNMAESYTVCNTTVKPKTPGSLTVNSSYLSKNLTLTFQSAMEGDAVLHIKASVAGGTSTKRIAVNLNGTRVGSLENNTTSAISMEEDIRINGVKKGDVISVAMSDSSNHKLYSMSYNRAE